MATVLYVYFVSFRTPTGFGNATVNTHAPITRRQQLDDIEADLRQQLRDPQVAVVSYQLLHKQPA